MKRTFYKLPEKRQRQILAACILEFAQYGYTAASVNRILKRLGLSKGGFYKYTTGKTEVYLFLVDEGRRLMQRFLEGRIGPLDPDLLERIRFVIHNTFAFARKHPSLYLMLLRAETDRSSPLYAQLERRRARDVAEQRAVILDGIDWRRYRGGKSKIIAVVFWLLGALRMDILANLKPAHSITEIESIVTRRLDQLIDLLGNGIRKKRRR